MTLLRNWRKWRDSLNVKMITLLLVIIMLPAWGIISFFSHIAATQTKDLLQDRAQMMTDTVNQLMNETYSEAAYMLNSLSNSIEGMQDLTPLQERLKHTRFDAANVLAAFAVIDSRIYYSDDVDIDVDATSREWYKQAMLAPTEVAVSLPYKDYVTDSMVVTFSMKLPNHHGVVGLDLAMDKIMDTISKHHVGEDGYMSLIDSANTVVSHPVLEAGTSLDGRLYGELFNHERGDFYTTHQKKEWFVSYNKGNPMHLCVMAVIPKEEMTGIASSMYKQGLIFSFILLACIGVCGWMFSKHVIAPIVQVQRVSEKIAIGDLTSKLSMNAKRRDEIAQMTAHINTMAEQMRRMMLQLQHSSASLAASSQELSANADENAASIQQMAVSVGEVNTQAQATGQRLTEVHQLAEEESGTLHDVTGYVQKTTEEAHRMQEWAEQGERSVMLVNEQMEQIRMHTDEAVQETLRLNQEMSRVREMTAFIQHLAKQTHVLSMNASIEAAHAGEHGKGFAVVAEEVRKLAQETQAAAGDIANVVEKIEHCSSSVSQVMVKSSESVTNGQNLTEHTADQLQAIFGAISRVHEQLEEMHTSSRRMLERNELMMGAFAASIAESSQITSEMETLAAISEQQSAAMQEIAASTNHLASVAEDLQAMTANYKLD